MAAVEVQEGAGHGRAAGPLAVTATRSGSPVAVSAQTSTWSMVLAGCAGRSRRPGVAAAGDPLREPTAAPPRRRGLAEQPAAEFRWQQVRRAPATAPAAPPASRSVARGSPRSSSSSPPDRRGACRSRRRSRSRRPASPWSSGTRPAAGYGRRTGPLSSRTVRSPAAPGRRSPRRSRSSGRPAESLIRSSNAAADRLRSGRAPRPPAAGRAASTAVAASTANQRRTAVIPHRTSADPRRFEIRSALSRTSPGGGRAARVGCGIVLHGTFDDR